MRRGGVFEKVGDSNGIEFFRKNKNKEVIWRKEGKKREIFREF